MKRSLALASLFVSCLLNSCQPLGRYQMVVDGPLDGFSPSAEDHVVYRLNTETGEIEYLMEMPILTDDRDNPASAHYIWEKIYIDLERKNR